jgi:hypothetical protein
MSKRILVVEDQPDNRQIIRDMLAPADYEITEAEDGEQALDGPRVDLDRRQQSRRRSDNQRLCPLPNTCRFDRHHRVVEPASHMICATGGIPQPD